MRLWPIYLLAAACFGTACIAQSQGGEQQPHYQPGWPCTGKEPSFDPVYAKIAEATGGHLFLFDKPEVAGTSKLAISDLKHKDTVVRAAGKLDTFVDIPIPVDASMDSLFIVASLQCMQTILLYDPLNASVNPDQSGGEDNWFRAGRIAVVSKPQPGVWTLRLAGTGPYFVAVQAHATRGMHGVTLSGGQEKTVSLSIDPGIDAPQFRLIRPDGQSLQTLELTPEPASPGRFKGSFVPKSPQFRILMESIDINGNRIQRVDPRLFDAAPLH